MKAEEPLTVFVYGTLKPGGRFWEKYCAGRVVESKRARVRGRLFHLRKAGYPAMAEDTTHDPRDQTAAGWVRGWWLVLKSETALRGLDELEGYRPGREPQENEYQRVRRECFAEIEDSKLKIQHQPDPESQSGPSLGEAWVYVMTPDWITRLSGALVKDGEWDEKKTPKLWDI